MAVGTSHRRELGAMPSECLGSCRDGRQRRVVEVVGPEALRDTSLVEQISDAARGGVYVCC
jgi:hypothetical protein